jgi:hypothetical protein
MKKNNPLLQEVNFIISVVFIGSVALLAMVSMLRASEMEDPIENALLGTAVEDGW